MKDVSINESARVFHFVQIARCVAAFLVVVDHALLGYNSIYAAANSGWSEKIAWRIGGFGVYLFFIISGFVITVGHLKDFNGRKSVDFILKRFVRIAPIYWAVTLAYAFKLSLKGVDFDWSNIVTSLLFIPYGCMHAACGRPMLELGWTLQYEVFFYCIFAFALCFRAKVGISFLVIVLALMALIGLANIPIELPLGYYFEPILLYFLMGVVLALFVDSGAYLAMQRAMRAISVLGQISIIVVMLIVAVLAIVFVSDMGLPFLEFIFLLVLALLSLREITEKDTAVLENRPIGGKLFRLLLLLGAASYSLYLTHVFVLGAFVTLVRLSGFYMPFVIYLFMASIAASLLAVLIYFCFERPSQKILKRLLKL